MSIKPLFTLIKGRVCKAFSLSLTLCVCVCVWGGGMGGCGSGADGGKRRILGALSVECQQASLIKEWQSGRLQSPRALSPSPPNVALRVNKHQVTPPFIFSYLHPLFLSSLSLS